MKWSNVVRKILSIDEADDGNIKGVSLGLVNDLDELDEGTSSITTNPHY